MIESTFKVKNEEMRKDLKLNIEYTKKELKLIDGKILVVFDRIRELNKEIDELHKKGKNLSIVYHEVLDDQLLSFREINGDIITPKDKEKQKKWSNDEKYTLMKCHFKTDSLDSMCEKFTTETKSKRSSVAIKNMFHELRKKWISNENK